MALPTIYVDQNATGAGDGSSPADAFTTISAAIAAANDGDTISIAAGDYTGSPVDIPSGKALSFVSANAGVDPDNWTNPEVIIDRIVSLSSVSVDGIHVHATIGGDLDTTSSNGPYWQAIGTSQAGLEVTVKNSVIDGEASGVINPAFDQPFGLNLTYGGGDVVVDHVHFLPFTGLDPANTAYGIWINATNTASSVTITNSEFATGAPKNAAIAFDGEHDGPNIVITGNTFEDPGVSPGAIRFFDFGDVNSGTQTFPGITGNTMVGDGPIISNESGDNVVVNSNDIVAGTSADETFVADGGNDTVDGAGGSDTYDMSASDTGGSVVDLNTHIAFSSNTGHDTLSNIENLKGGVGADDLYGDGGDNVFFASGGIDTMDGRGNGLHGDTFDASSATTTVDVDLTTGAVTGEFTATLTNIENVKTGDGDDTITLSGAANAVDGGAGLDTAHVDAAYVSSAIGYSGGAFTYSGGDTLTNVEKMTFTDKTVWLVHNSAELTAALAGAGDGDAIKLASGTYVGNFTVSDAVTIEAATGVARDVVLSGNFRALNGLAPNDSVADFLKTHGSPVATGNGLVIGHDGVTLKNITITEYSVGVAIQGNSGLTIDHVDFDSNLNAIRKGTAEQVTNFTWTGGTVSNGQYGMNIYGGKSLGVGVGSFDQVHIDGVSFSNLNEKGLYFEQLSNAEIENIGMDNVGQWGRTSDGKFGAGIDINLKYNAYSNIDIHDFEFDNVGASLFGDAVADATGAAILVKARSDGSDYGNPPATVSGVQIHDGSIDGTSTGVRAGEPGQTGAASNVIVTNVEISSALVAEYDNRTTSTLTVNIDAGDQNVSSNPDATGVIAYVDSTTGNTTYTVNAIDTVTENSATGTDTVNARGSFTLGANVENLNLVDAGSGSENFENFAVGGIANGENGWTHNGSHDAEIVDLSGNKVFRMSSDPASGDFGGPYSPDIGVTAGEPQTTSDGNVHVLSFKFKSVQNVADNSRLEVDIGKSNATDRNNFMIIENVAGGLRVAAAGPVNLTGDFEPEGNAFPDDWGTVIAGVDPTAWHTIELHTRYIDGPNNDVVEIWLDGAMVGTTTTFENYRDFNPESGNTGNTHLVNAENNQTNRIFFRGGGNGQPQDGPGGDNQGFYFDDITNTITTDSTATGNSLANVINGNSGHNVINGLGGADTINGANGNDTIDGGTGIDSVNGGLGNDLIKEAASDADVVDGGAGTDMLQIDGTSGDDSVVVLYNGTKIASINGGAISNVEAVNLALAGNTATGDTLSYATSSQAVTVNLGAGTASGFASISGVENVVGGSGGDSLTGNSSANVLTGGAGNDTVDGGGGTDTVVFENPINEYTIQYDSGTQTWAITRNGTIDIVKGVEFFKFGAQTVDVSGDAEAVVNKFAPVFTPNGAEAVSVAENVANVQVYDAAATDADSASTFGNIVYSLEGTDAGAFSINAASGVVTLTNAADREVKSSYAITIKATQGTTSATKALTVNVSDADDNPVVFSSGSTASVQEGTAIATVVYDADATDADLGSIVYSLSGTDQNAFTIDSATGQVQLKAVSDFEAKSSYAFNVVGTNGSSSASQAVTLTVTNVDEGISTVPSAPVTVQVEKGSTKAPLGTLSSGGVTFDVDALNKGGGHVYNGNTELSVGQTGLTLAQINALTFSSLNDGAIQFTAHDGGNSSVLNVILDVTPGVSKTYKGDGGDNYVDGANGNDTVLGKGGADVLLGGKGMDTIKGGTGADTIYGGKGQDLLKGGSGPDTFVFDSTPNAGNADVIKGFVHGTDTIALDGDIFSALGAALGQLEFRANLTGDAQDGNDMIIYNKNTGELFFDADGDQSGAKVLVATLDPHISNLSNLDFEIV